MAQVYFKLDTTKIDKTDKAPIVLYVTFNSIRIRKSTKQKTKLNHWNDRHLRVKPPLKSEADNNYQFINHELDRIEKKAKDIINYALLNEIELDKKYFESEWNKNLLNKTGRKLVLEYFDQFINSQKSECAPNTIKNLTTVRNFIERFSKAYNSSLSLEEMNVSTFEKMREFAFNGENNYNTNYFATIIQKTKTFLNWAYNNEYHDNLAFKRFKVSNREPDIICLYEDELFRLYRKKFKRKALEKTRDLYCFGCFTGLRFSDIIDLKREHIQGDVIKKKIIKTKENETIPLNKYAKEILEKYKDLMAPLPKISEQKFNKYIKDACQEAKINSRIIITKFSGSKRIEKTYEKHQLITSHTARKTYVTNSLIFGMSPVAVKKITGHKKEENFRRYIRLADEYLQEENNNAWDRN